MSSTIHTKVDQKKCRRERSSRTLAFAGLMAMFAITLSTLAQAAPPLGPTSLGVEEKPGVTLYQADGLKGQIPLKRVWVSYPAGDGYWDLQFASANMNINVQFIAKFVLPDNMAFKAFEVNLLNSNVPNNVQITTNSADKWDGKTMVDKVTLAPWTMSEVLKQCKQQLDNGDGTFKNTATFNLQASVSDRVRAKGFYIYPGNSNTHSFSSLELKPTTRVTAFIVESDRKGQAPNVSRIKAEQPSPDRIAPQRVQSAVVKPPAASNQPPAKANASPKRNATQLKPRRTP